jgi:amylosucrase
VLAFQRPGADGVVLVLANFGDHPVHIDALTLSGVAPDAVDLVADEDLSLADGVTLAPHAFLWLRVRPTA